MPFVLWLLLIGGDSALADSEGSFGSFTRDLNETDWGYQLVLDPTGLAATEEVERFEIRAGDCARDAYRDDCADKRERAELTERSRPHRGVHGLGWYRWQIYFPDDYPAIYPARAVHVQFGQQRIGPAWVFEIGATGVLWVGNRLEEGGAYQALIDEDVLRGEWHDIVVRANWSKNDDGQMTVWVNGVKKADYRGRTCSSCRVYFSYGISREGLARFRNAYPEKSLPTQVVYYTNVLRSDLSEGLRTAGEQTMMLQGLESSSVPAAAGAISAPSKENEATQPAASTSAPSEENEATQPTTETSPTGTTEVEVAAPASSPATIDKLFEERPEDDRP